MDAHVDIGLSQREVCIQSHLVFKEVKVILTFLLNTYVVAL